MNCYHNLSTKDINYLFKHKVIEFNKIKHLKEHLVRDTKLLSISNFRDLSIDEYNVLVGKYKQNNIAYEKLCIMEDVSCLRDIETLNKSSLYSSYFGKLLKLRKDVAAFENDFWSIQENVYVEPIVEKVERTLEVRLDQLESTVEAIESGQDILRDEVDVLQDDINELKEPSE